MNNILRNVLTALFFTIVYYAIDILFGTYTLGSLPIIQMFNQFLMLLAIFFAIDLVVKFYQRLRHKKSNN